METKRKEYRSDQEVESSVFHPEDKSVSFEELAPISNLATEEEISEHFRIMERMTPKEKYLYKKVRAVAEEKIEFLVEGMGFASYETMTRFFLYEKDDEAVGFHSVVENDFHIPNRAIRVSWENLREDDLRESVATVIHEKIHNLAQYQQVTHENGIITSVGGLSTDTYFASEVFSIPTEDLKKILEGEDANTESVIRLLIQSFVEQGIDLFSSEGEYDEELGRRIGWKEKVAEECGISPELVKVIARFVVQYEFTSLEEVQSFIREKVMNEEGGADLEDENQEFEMQKIFIQRKGEALDEATVEFLAQYAVGLEKTISNDEGLEVIKPVNSHATDYAYSEWTGIWINCADTMNTQDTQMFIDTLKQAEFRSNPGEIIQFFKRRFEISLTFEELQNMDLEDLPDRIKAHYESEESSRIADEEEVERLREFLKKS